MNLYNRWSTFRFKYEKIINRTLGGFLVFLRVKIISDPAVCNRGLKKAIVIEDWHLPNRLTKVNPNGQKVNPDKRILLSYPL